MPASPALVEIGATGAGRHVLPVQDLLVLGRDPSADVVFADDDTVSRRHATIRWQDGEAWIADLHSTSGTYVNAERLTAPRRLLPGDRVELGGLQLRFVGPESAATRLIPPVTAPSAAARFDVGAQSAGMINNVGRDQHLAYLHVQEQRESFARQVAATRTKARWLVWLGVLISVVGYVLAGRIFLGMLDLMAEFFRVGQGGGEPDFGQWMAGMKEAALGASVVTLGGLMVIVGIVLHIIATSRRKRVEREYPLPPGWSSARDGARP